MLSFSTAAALETAAGSWLAQDGRTSNLIFSRLKVASRRGDLAQGWLVVADDAPQLVLLTTSPHPVLSGGGVKAAGCLAGI